MLELLPRSDNVSDSATTGTIDIVRHHVTRQGFKRMFIQNYLVPSGLFPRILLWSGLHLINIVAIRMPALGLLGVLLTACLIVRSAVDGRAIKSLFSHVNDPIKMGQLNLHLES